MGVEGSWLKINLIFGLLVFGQLPLYSPLRSPSPSSSPQFKQAFRLEAPLFFFFLLFFFFFFFGS